MSRKVIITGASGLLGRALVAEFSKESWDVLGLAFSRAKGDLRKVDLNDKEEVKKIFTEFEPAVIVHSAAQRSPDKVEKEFEASHKLNVQCSRTLAELAAEVNAAFIFISTDYVFDGTNPPYKETDEPNPLNQYGKTKAEAEKSVTEVNPDSCILRIPVLYGDEEYLGESAISSLLNYLLNPSVPAKISDYEVRFPSHTEDIAAVCSLLADKKLQDSTVNGVHHWCGSEPFTKYTMTKVMAEVFALPMKHLSPDSEPSSGAPRPKNTQLCRGRLGSLGIGLHTPFRAGVRKSFSKFVPHAEQNTG